MKKNCRRYLTFLLMCLLYLTPVILKAQTTSITGNPILDARGLSACIKAGDTTGILKFFNANSPVQYKTYMIMMASIDPVLAKIFKPATSTLTSNVVTLSASSDDHIIPQGLPLSSTDGIDALGSFIADRFKQEMEIAFLDNLKAKLAAVPELSALLPITDTVLKQNNPYQYTTFLESLKEGLNKDVNNLPYNVGQYLATDPYKLAASKPLYFPAIIVYQNLLKIIQGQSVAVLLDTLNNETLVQPNNTYNSYFRLLSLLSRTLTNPAAISSNTPWWSAGEIATYIKDPADLQSFYGLFLIKEKNELNKINLNNQTLYGIILTNTNDVGKATVLYNWIINVTQSYTALYNSYSNIKILLTNKTISGLQVTDCANALVNCINAVSLNFPYKDMGITLPPDLQKIQNEIPLITKNITALAAIAADVKDKNYGLALISSVTILQMYLGTNLSQTTIDLINKYGNFAVSVVKAQNKDDMVAALDAAALPVGSYRIKRNSYANISLNAYAGLSGGHQWYNSSVPGGVNATNTTLGFTAPVGISFSLGTYKTLKEKNSKIKADSLTGHSHTLFISAIDLGAVTSYRLTQDASAPLPDLTWENVIAPGAYYIFGFGKVPLSIGGGVQYGPQLRSITNNSTGATAVILPSAWSAKIFLAVDIPVFSFYTKNERKDGSTK